MMRQWRLVYDWPDGSRGALFVSTLSRAGAVSLFRARFPFAKVVRVSEVRP